MEYHFKWFYWLILINQVEYNIMFGNTIIRGIIITLILLVTFSCSNNKSDDTVIFHFSKKEMRELNKTGKVVQTDDKGVERAFIYDDKFSEFSKKNETDPKKLKKKQDAEKKKLADKKAAEAKKLADKKAAEAKKLAEEQAIAEANRLAEEKAAAERKFADEQAAAEAKRLEGEGEYKDGKKDGVWEFYDEEGVKEKEILFADGIDTLHTYYSSNGNKLKEGKMVDGKEEGNWAFYDENGVKERETEHKAGQEEGIYTIFHDNGQMSIQGPYANKLRIGKWTWWYETGEKWKEGDYVADQQRDGAWVVWNKDGSLREETIYESGDFQSKKVY